MVRLAGVDRFAGVAAVVFDFDGTLAHLTIDFDLMRREILALVSAHHATPTGLERLYVLELVEAAAARVAAVNRDAGAFRAAARMAIERIELVAARNGSLLSGVKAALDDLKGRGYRVGIVTRNCAAAVVCVLDRSRGAPLSYDVLLTRDDVPRVKPDPAHLAAALAALDVPPAAAVMVGDHPMDVEAGRRAGMRTVGVLTGRRPRADFEAAGADLVLDEAATLPAWLPTRAAGGHRGG